MKAYIKTRRTATQTTCEAYQYGGENHGDAIGLQCSISQSLLTPARQIRAARHGLMVKLCNAGIIPVTQIDGIVLCFPNGKGGIEMIGRCA